MRVDLERVVVRTDATIKESIEKIDKYGLQIVVVVDAAYELKGTVTDGDIRRGILKGKLLSDPITEVMNKNPICSKGYRDTHQIISLMHQFQIRHIPIVDDLNVLIDLMIMDELVRPSKKEHWIVIMAGGLGTRLSPLTNDCPKPLLNVGGRPLLQTILENLIAAGFHRFFFSVNYKAEMIENYFGDGSKWNVEIRYIRETKRLGTGGALSLLPVKPDIPFIVMNGDLLTKVDFGKLLDFHLEHHSVATMCVRNYELQIPYGVVNVNKHQLISIEEKPIRTSFVNAGIYVLNPEVLDVVPKDIFYDMPSLFDTLLQSGRSCSAYPIMEYWMDIGRVDDYETANNEFLEVFK